MGSCASAAELADESVVLYAFLPLHEASAMSAAIGRKWRLVIKRCVSYCFNAKLV